MDTSPDRGSPLRSPVAVMQTALRDGVDRYRALRESPESRTFLLAATGAYVGRRFTTIGLIALSYKLGDGVLGVGGMLAVQLFPSLILQPMAGVLVDRFPGKRLFVICQLLMAAVTLSYLMLIAIPSIWLLLALTFVFGAIQTVEMPAMEVRLMSLTHRERRGTANAVQMLAITTGEIVGPLIAGIILAISGTALLFILNALIYLLFARVIVSLPNKVEGSTSTADEEGAASNSTKPGYMSLLRRTDVRLYNGLVASSYMLFYGIVPLYIVRALELGLGEASVGMFYTVMGFGALIGGILAGMGTYTSRSALAIAGTIAIPGAACAVLFGLANTLLLAMFSLLLFGLIGDIEEIAAMTYFQNTLPESVYGRFFSIFMVANGIGGLIGALAGPILVEMFNTGVAVAVLASPTLVFGTLLAIRGGGFRLPLRSSAKHLGAESRVPGN